MNKKFIFPLSILLFLFLLGVGLGLSQPVSQEESQLEVEFGNILYKIREIESTPSPLKLLEFHIEIFNRSQNRTAPPNSIKVVVIQKEVKYSSTRPVEEFSPPPQEAILHTSLPPMSGKVLIIGVQIPKENVESFIYEVQINPPEGEKKIVSINL